MRHLLSRLGSFAGLLAISGAALAADANACDAAADGANCLPEPGVLELMAIAAVVGWVIKRTRGGR